MKVSELIKELSKFNGNLEVYFNHNYNECNGGCDPDGYCYCCSEDHLLNLAGVDNLELKIFNSKFKKNQRGIVLQTRD